MAQILNLQRSRRKPRMFYNEKSSTFVKLADTETVLILIATSVDVILIRNTKINMVVTLSTSCAVIWLIRTKYITFLGVSSRHSSLGPSSVVGEKDPKKSAIESSRAEVWENGFFLLSSPPLGSLFSLTFYVCRFILFFAIFPTFEPFPMRKPEYQAFLRG